MCAGFERARPGLGEQRELVAAHPQPHFGCALGSTNHCVGLFRSERVRMDAHPVTSASLDSHFPLLLQPEVPSLD